MTENQKTGEWQDIAAVQDFSLGQIVLTEDWTPPADPEEGNRHQRRKAAKLKRSEMKK